MRALQFLNAAILSTLVATSASLYAQDEKPPENKPPRQEEPRPEPKQDEMKPPRQDEAQPPKQEKQEQKEEKQEQKQSREDMKQNRQEPAAQNDAHARPAGKSGHIPDDRFRSNFGRSHTFVVQRTTVVEGRPGFVYGGYSFVFVDPWPVGWAYTDDCYVDYVDGDYFLFDMLHPGVRIALFVVM